jgi:hypothetical protein
VEKVLVGEEMDISDLSGAADSDDQLEEFLHELLEAASERLDGIELPRTQVSQLQGKGGHAEHVQVERPSLQMAVGDIQWLEDVDEAIAFVDHVEDEYNESLDEHYLSKMFVDAFGRDGQDLDSFEEKEDRIANNVVADIHGQGRAELIAPLEGLNMETDVVRIRDNVEIRNYEDGMVLGENSIPVLSDTLGGPYRIYNDAYLRIEFTEDDMLSDPSMQAMHLYTAAISLSLGGWVRDIRTYIKPITYGMFELGRELSSGRESGFSVDIDEEHGPQIRNALNLLEPYFDLADEQYEPPYAAIHNFSGPANIAISHYGRAIQMWSIPDNSVTFAILGLESLYIQHTSGETPSKDVPRFAGFLIGNTVDEFEPLSIADYINEGYELRNQWAHGGKPGGEPSELQGLLWAILRASIFVFYWLDTNTSLLDEGLPLDEALIDEDTREEVTEELDGFDLTDYM